MHTPPHGDPAAPGAHRQEPGAGIDELNHQLLLANDALRKAARFNRMVADANPGGVTYWDRELHCRLANRSFAASVARRPDDMTA